MRIYIAGPMSGYEHHNYHAFEQARGIWITKGHNAITPFDSNNIVFLRKFGRSFRYGEKVEYGDPLVNDLMAEDFYTLCMADAIALLPGWEKSRGAKIELAVALNLGKEVYDAVTFERLYFEYSLTFNPKANV